MTDIRLREQGIVWREVDGEIVILDTQKSVYASINRSGSVLWLCLASGGATREHLVAQLQERFGLNPEMASRDVDAFLALMRDQGMLR